MFTKEIKKAFSHPHDVMMQLIKKSSFEEQKENANIDGKTPMGKMSTIASATSKDFAMENLIKEEIRNAMEDNLLHIHDLDYYLTGTTTCVQIPLAKLLESGFSTGHGYMRTPASITSALALTAIIFQANQNMQHGGQSIPTLDWDLAPYVRKTFVKQTKHICEIREEFDLLEEIDQHIQQNEARIEYIADQLSRKLTVSPENKLERIWIQAINATMKETFQACEAFIHNSNSMHSRGGSQVPFISINYGMCENPWGRILIENILLATQKGLGKGETPIFPIHVFKVKEGVNLNPNDPNYDLFRLALQTTAKRLFPNFAFLDAPFNMEYYEKSGFTKEGEVAYMGCRTRVMSNRHGEETTLGRGNLSFTSINLVKLALLSNGNVEEFFKKLDAVLALSIEQLHDRYEFQMNRYAREFPFLYSQGVWRGGETLKSKDEVKEILKQGTLSVGFIGLAECLVALIGQHHGQSEEAQALGIRIVDFMRSKCDMAAEAYDLNYSLIATPAESLSGRFVRKDKVTFGSIPGITDRDYYTNSYHIPVYFKTNAYTKINKEAPYHAYCNAGHISYVELDNASADNVDAFEQIVRYMWEAKIGYGSINHPVDHCKCCEYTGIIVNACPKCGNSELDLIERVRRITGYLTGTLDRWNSAKQAEERERLRH